MLAASGEECTVTDVGSTKAAVCRRRRLGPLRRRPSGLRLRGARPRARERRALPGRDLVPDAAPRDRRRAATGSSTASSSGLGATPVAVDPEAHDRLVALTSHLPHALANLLVNQAGATRVEGHDPLAVRGRLASGHDARRRREPADLGRHLPRERRADARRRSPSTAAGSSSSRTRSPPGTPASSRAGSARRRATGGGCSRSPTPTRARSTSCACTCPTGRACSPAITQALGAERINIEDFELQHVSPERGGVLHVLVAGEREAERAAALLERAGLRRRRLAGARRMTLSRARVGARRAHRASRATSGSPSARCCSARSREGESRSRGSGARRTPSRRSRRCGRSAPRSTRTRSRLVRVRGVGLRGLRAPDEPLDFGNAGTVLRLLPGILAGQEGALRADRRRVASARPQERIAEPLRRWARAIETTEGTLPVVIEGGRALRDPLRAAGRERAGEVGRAARGAARRGRGDTRRRAEPDPRPHGAPAPRARRRGFSGEAPDSVAPVERLPPLALRSPATSRRRRRSSSRRRSSAARSSSSRA